MHWTRWKRILRRWLAEASTVGVVLTLLWGGTSLAGPPGAAAVETELRLGTAVDLGGDRWATAAHVVCGLSRGASVRLDGRPARVVGRAEGMDLAVLEAPSRATVNIGPEPPAGARVSAVGATRTGLRRSEGTASGRSLRLEGYGEGFVVRLDAVAAPGFSGGPVLGEDGRVLGILVALRTVVLGNKEGFVLPMATVRSAVTRAHLQPLPC